MVHLHFSCTWSLQRSNGLAVLTRRNVVDSHNHRTLNRHFQKTVSDRHGRPSQELLATWCVGSVEGSTSRVRALEEGQRLPERAHRSISLSRLLHAQRRVRSKLRHCRPCVAIVVYVRHHKNGLPSLSVASPWSSLPSPPHRRVNRASVRANRRFSSTAAMAVLAGAGAPRGQRSSHPCHPSSISR